MTNYTARALAVGHYHCPNPIHSKPTLAVIRMKTNGTLYGFCGTCGLTNWNLAAGQEFFNRHGNFWPANGEGKFAPRLPPAELPQWIRLNRAWAPESARDIDAINEDAPPKDPYVAPTPNPAPAVAHAPAAPAVKPEAPKPKPRAKRGYLLPFETDEDDV